MEIIAHVGMVSRNHQHRRRHCGLHPKTFFETPAVTGGPALNMRDASRSVVSLPWLERKRYMRKRERCGRKPSA